MSKLTAMVMAGVCMTLLAASGCNRILPAMEPYDDYKTRLKNPGEISQSSLPVLKPKEDSQTASAGGQK